MFSFSSTLKTYTQRSFYMQKYTALISREKVIIDIVIQINDISVIFEETYINVLIIKKMMEITYDS